MCSKPTRFDSGMKLTTGDDLTIYTVIIGTGYDLPEVKTGSSCRFICFTDQANLKSRGWKIQVVKPIIPTDETRSSREIKIRPHRWISSSRSLYIDPSVTLTVEPEAVWNFLMGSGKTVKFAAFLHSFRTSVRDEFAICKESGLESAFVLQEHFFVLEQSLVSTLDERPIWTGILARRHHSPEVVQAMETWWAHVLRYSRRDQLSANTALALLDPTSIALLDHDNHISPVHTWPRASYRRPDRYYESARTRYAHVTEELDRLRAAVQSAQERADAARRSEAAAQERAEAATVLVASLEFELEQFRRR